MNSPGNGRLWLAIPMALLLASCGGGGSSTNPPPPPPPAAATYTVGGTVSGLGTGKTLVLRNNGGNDLALNANGSFTFATPVASAATYAVTVFTQPAGQTCTVNNGSGTMAAANVGNVAVSCTAATGNTIAAADCSSAAIQAAVNAAADGDTVTVPACAAATWAGGVSIPSTKGITLQGAGADRTIISTGFSLSIDTLPTRAPVRLTGFRFIRTNASTRVFMLGTAQNWRIDNNVFDDAGIAGAYTIEVGVKGNENLDSYNYGVIDHNRFINRNYSTSIHVSWVRWGAAQLDRVASGDWVWSQPAQRGTAQAVYIEDNEFSGTLAASQVMDTQFGAKAVVRYNRIHNPWISTHSGCTNGGRHSPWTEVYRNTLTDDANRYGGSSIELRSTSGIVWGNTSAARLNNYPISVDHERSYRTDCSGVYGGRADGTRSFDENSGLHGYRALGQPGWGAPQAANMSNATFAGVFAWQNLNGGSLNDLFIANNNGFTPEHLQFGRELFNASNMAAGPIAARAQTCSAGPPRSVYVATDENSQGATVYVCTAANVWTRHWEPYTYPHPSTQR